MSLSYSFVVLAFFVGSVPHYATSPLGQKRAGEIRGGRLLTEEPTTQIDDNRAFIFFAVALVLAAILYSYLKSTPGKSDDLSYECKSTLKKKARPLKGRALVLYQLKNPPPLPLWDLKAPPELKMKEGVVYVRFIAKNKHTADALDKITVQAQFTHTGGRKTKAEVVGVGNGAYTIDLKRFKDPKTLVSVKIRADLETDDTWSTKCRTVDLNGWRTHVSN